MRMETPKYAWEFESFYDFGNSHITYYVAELPDGTKVFKSVQVMYRADGQPSHAERKFMANGYAFDTEQQLTNFLWNTSTPS